MTKEFLKEFTDELKAFFKEQGGLDNGYETYASGEIRENVSCYINWETPKACHLTRQEHQKLAAELYDRLYAICKKHNQWVISLHNYHIEHGVYDTYIRKTEEERIRLV